jgi:FAD/FMN-containing dehydrogenase
MGTSGTVERLARRVTGQVFAGGDPAAVAEAAGFNTAVAHRPAMVVAASNARDVAAAVRYANHEGIQVAVQATGHGASAPSAGTVFVSTKRMQGVQIDPVARVARVEAGVRWRKVIEALEPWSTGTSLVNFVGHAGEPARGRAWTPDTLERLCRVKATIDPRNVFGGGLTVPANVPAGAR